MIGSKAYSPDEWRLFPLHLPDHLLLGEVGEAFTALATGGRWLKIPPGRRGDGGQDVLTPRGWFLQVKTVSRVTHEFVVADPERTARRAHLVMDVWVDLEARRATLRGWTTAPEFYENCEEFTFPNTDVRSLRMTGRGRTISYRTGTTGLEETICGRYEPWGLGYAQAAWPGWPSLLENARGL